jgi:lipopolysaccharide transport system ATP-binding protein
VSSSVPIISARNLSKAYSIYERPSDVLKEVITGRTRHDVFWALKDVSFDVHEGERVGIIGPNGAGKSTLLQLVTGNLTQTTGTVEVRGRISAMLSLVSFLNVNESGLENIRFNLILNGVDKRDVPRLTDEIVDFAELGSFIYAPVRTYSSGMNARLAFSIATVVTPDVLVIDEVLGAGDAYFSAKAMQRMTELCNEGRSLLFVSHATSAVQLICNKAIWLDSGGIRDVGPVEEVVRRYEDDFRRAEDERVRLGNVERRNRLRRQIRPAEVVSGHAVRLRLIGPGNRLHETHFVRRLSVDVDGRRREVSLYIDDRTEEGARLDLVHSEWGRAHERRGEEARALASSARPLSGGHVIVGVPGVGEQHVSLTVEVESTSDGVGEELSLQVADLETGEWVDLERVASERLRDGWRRVTFTGTALAPQESLKLETVDRIIAASRPDVEIVDISMAVDGEPTLAVRERQPFEITVRLFAHHRVPCVDVWLKIVRTDGTYVFWQSSGQVDKNLLDLDGECEVVFRFDPNIFGGAEYDVTVDLGNGFDIERNFPHSEVFDRRVHALQFLVRREWPIYDTPPLNYRFPVEVRRAVMAEEDGNGLLRVGTRP